MIHVIKEKKKIGAIFGFGTLWNMTGVGLLVDFFTTKYHIFFQNPQNLGIRILFLVIAILGICLGCSIYMTPVITAFGTGPFVQFFNEHISKPWLHHKRRGRYAVRRTTEPIQ